MLRKSLDASAIGLMVLLCACWGLQQVAIKSAASALHPVTQIGIRSLVAALMLGALMAWRREGFSLRDGRLKPGLLAGLLFAGEFLLAAIGLLYTSASHMVVFLYTAPIFTALALHWRVAGERLVPRQWLGVLMAFAGVAVVFSTGLFGGEATTRMLIGDALGIGAGMLWAATTLVIRASSLSEAPASQTLMYQLGVAAVSMLVAGPLLQGARPMAHMAPMDGLVWANLAFQSLVVAFASFLAWFWLLRRYLASRLSAFSFLTPLFGVSFGVLFLGERLEPQFVAGAVLVLAGIVLVNLRR
ncbi:EamA family transporter [Rhodoferax koreense]|uniref:EamA family transporter n=1 Tax=Rhodoferax koreensis TaxID=1842727 RepID=A0A1P8JRZ4_9BURK|nr:DMT family transporter [Rhodoferax koreense]APW36495.1 EamA family transporter [Rhodoferax koreense]